jgi:hypothetical protein
MVTKQTLRKGMSIGEVDAILGPNGEDEPREGTAVVRVYELLVADEENPGTSRLACADARFVKGKLVEWSDEVELIAETWRKIQAGDPATRRAAGMKD